MAPQQHLHRLPRPTSMLFDLEMEEAPGHQHQLDAEGLQAVQAVSNLVSRAMAAASQPGRARGAAGLGQLLGSNMGYAVSLRESLGGGSGGQCLRNLRHCCLVLQRPSTAHATAGSISAVRVDSIVVDPTFRDQFAIAHPSARYAAVLDSLPAVFVGHAGRIPQLVELLCAEMSLAFQAAGIVLPPWRHTRSMLSKWQPRRSIELPAAAAEAAALCAAAQPAGSSRQQQARSAPAAAGAASSSDDSSLLPGGVCGCGSGSGVSAVTHVGSNSSRAAGSGDRQQLPSVVRPGPGVSCAARPLASLG
ncbi:hypothetical protein COO60DRAFT_1491914 [Scenedesmus sp. NREL 46B-D3]|nr:hypothetical protein COO60DRAFT_1491914 [Scenedesmus sp. NREL 46B-D3]